MNWTTRLWLVLVVLAVAVSALFLLPKSRPETRIYIAGVDHSPPYYWVEPSGGVHGMAVEVFDEAARRIGIQLQWKPITESLDTALETHSVDLWPVVSITEERKRRVHLTEPWLANRFALLTLATSGIQTPEQLAGKKLAHLSFPRTRALAERFFPRSVRIEKPTRERAVEAVCEGEAAASFSEIRHIDALMLDRPKSCVGKAWSVLFVPGATVPMGIAAHASAAKAADSLRAEIIRMAEEGTLFPRMERWSPFSATETQSLFALWEAERRNRLLYSIGLILSIALVLLGWQIQRVRTARRVAENANRAKSEFLANISHEIRTPLNAIVGMADLAASTNHPEEQKEFLTAVRTASRSLLLLLNQVLDFSKIEAGHTEMEFSAFSIRLWLQDTLSAFEKQCEAKGLRLTSKVDAQVPEYLVGDRTKLFEVLSNLLSNALKFTDSGSIHLTAGIEDENERDMLIGVSVSDTGIGIAPDKHEIIFQAFRQADGSMARRFGGTGLGLAICTKLVQAMGGSIRVKSEPGNGSTFHFTVRLTKVLAQPTAEPAKAGEPHALHLRILLAEDNVLNQRLELRLLERAGHDVQLARSGREAVDAYAGASFDVVLMDIQMPEMDGLEATRAIRLFEVETGRHTPIIAMTACAGSDDERRCREAGMDGYIAKPIDTRALLDEIHRLHANGNNEPI